MNTCLLILIAFLLFVCAIFLEDISKSLKDKP